MYNNELFIKIINEKIYIYTLKKKNKYKRSIITLSKLTEIVLYHILTTMAAGKYDVNMQYQLLCPSSCSDFVWLR